MSNVILLNSKGGPLLDAEKTNTELGINSTLPNGEVASDVHDAFDIGFKEGVKHVELREKVNEYLSALEFATLEEIKDDKIFQVNGHHFGGGVYLRSQTVKAGHKITKHVHDYDHLSVLVAGTASVQIDDEEPVTYHAGEIITIMAGKQHSVTALNDKPILWFCIHKHDDDSVASLGEVLTERANV